MRPLDPNVLCRCVYPLLIEECCSAVVIVKALPRDGWEKHLAAGGPFARLFDETPAAYKDIDAVMAAQADLVEVVATLKQVLCVKG